MDVVVPTCGRDAEQARIMLRSVEANVAGDAFGTIHLVAIDEPAFVSRMRGLSTPGLRDRIEYLTARDVGIEGDPARRGWLMQQIAKLQFARRARTPFYVALDSKNVMLAPVARGDLMRDGRAPWVLEDAGIHPRWWRGSARVLDHAAFDYRSPRLVLSAATPVILHTASVVAMLDWIEARHRDAFERVFLRMRGYWSRPTEFCLYFAYLDREGVLDRHHFGARWLHDVAAQIWESRATPVRWQGIQRLLHEEPCGLFGGIASAVWHSLDDETRARVAERATRDRHRSRIAS
jgi:hypothetical protein